MAGHSRPKDGVLSHAYVPAIHVFLSGETAKAWMPGTRLVPGPAFGRTRVPGMTVASREGAAGMSGVNHSASP
jgi:hypothetical protein